MDQIEQQAQPLARGRMLGVQPLAENRARFRIEALGTRRSRPDNIDFLSREQSISPREVQCRSERNDFGWERFPFHVTIRGERISTAEDDVGAENHATTVAARSSACPE
jgi:hypothetical protein